MSDTSEITDKAEAPESPPPEAAKLEKSYHIQFRHGAQIFSATAPITDLQEDDLVMTQTDHGLEPATIMATGFSADPEGELRPAGVYSLIRKANREEINKFERLLEREQEAFGLCQQYIVKHKLAMKLIRVERFFNGSKVIFYFTAENRVDFRELVKDLVQEFRTRVEIRQIGVRHETKMIGGLGCCGRELCCATFINKFAPVSIKMAKEQNLPLNPAKISGICNRLLCCLTYEFQAYKAMKKIMPKPGKIINFRGKPCKVLQNNILQETVTVACPEISDKPVTLTRQDWENLPPADSSRKPAAKAETPAKTGGPKKETRGPRRGKRQGSGK